MFVIKPPFRPSCIQKFFMDFVSPPPKQFFRFGGAKKPFFLGGTEGHQRGAANSNKNLPNSGLHGHVCLGASAQPINFFHASIFPKQVFSGGSGHFPSSCLNLFFAFK